MASANTPKKTLRELEKGPAGKRFLRLYKQRREDSRITNWSFMGGGLVTIAGGVVTYPIPVIPSDIIILLGLAIFAQGSETGARALDWIERHFRKRFPGVIKLWKGLPRGGKIAVTTGWMALASTVGFLVYRALD